MTLQGLLGVELPVIQAPMAGAHVGALAIAAGQAGGLGSLPCAMLGPAAIRREIGAIRAALPSRPFNLNFFCHRPPIPDPAREAAWRGVLAPYYREFGLDVSAAPALPARYPFDATSAELVEEFRPEVVSFHYGLPDEPLLERVRATGARILSSATTLDEALWLEQRGVAAVIAQGLEAGGHRGHFLDPDLSLHSGTFALVPQLVRALRVPVIAAGGIADRAGVEAALRLGASMVQVGTAYLCCPETTTSPILRRTLMSVNRLMREVDDASAPEFPLATTAIAPLRAAAEARGSLDFSPIWCGQNASGCKERPAGELTRELAGV